MVVNGKGKRKVNGKSARPRTKKTLRKETGKGTGGQAKAEARNRKGKGKAPQTSKSELLTKMSKHVKQSKMKKGNFKHSKEICLDLKSDSDIQDGPPNDPKLVQDWSKTVPKVCIFYDGFSLQFRIILEPILVPIWIHLGSQDRSKIRSRIKLRQHASTRSPQEAPVV